MINNNSNTTIYLLRHAESQPDPSIPRDDWPLSRRGRQQARDLVPRLSGLGVTGIYSSPCLRAKETVRPFAASAALEINVYTELRDKEMFQGWASDFMALARRTWEDFTFVPPGGESNLATQARMRRAIREIAQRHPHEAMLAASHGSSIGLLLNSIDPAFGFDDAVAMTSPDMFKIVVRDGWLTWDRSVRLEAKGP